MATIGTRLTVELSDGAGVRIGALENVTGLTVTDVRNGARSIRGTIDAESEKRLVQEMVEGKTRVLAYLGEQLVAHTLLGPCRDTIEGGEAKIEFTSADPLASLLTRRRVQTAHTYAGVDQGAIIKGRIDTQNARASTFVGTSAYSFTTGVTRTLTVERGKPEAEIIAELCAAYNGVDFAVMPTEGATMGQARVWASRGASVPVYFGTGSGSKRNIASVNVDVDPGKITTHQRVGGANDQAWGGNNAATQTAYGTIFDSYDSLSDISQGPLLQAYGTKLLEWRSGPRILVTIEPADTTTYLPVRDFNVADYLGIHIDAGRWTEERAISGDLRCYGWTLTRDKAGYAKLDSLTVTPEAS